MTNTSTLPVIAFTLHDPKGIFIERFRKVVPILKENFSKTFIGITPPTLYGIKEEIEKFYADDFLKITTYDPSTRVGDHFVELYKNIVKDMDENAKIHLTTDDRITYILSSEHKRKYLKDISEVRFSKTAVLFQRTYKAWDTHPRIYRVIENLATSVGRGLFTKTLDYCWCYFVMTAGQLSSALPFIKSHDITVFAELAHILKDDLTTKDVDWLSWEDPFIMEKDPGSFREERDGSEEEIERRLNYVIPMVKFLISRYQKGKYGK